MGPYREPQPAPPLVRDPMRVVLIVAGGVATCIVVAMVVLLVMDRRANARSNDKKTETEKKWSWVRIDRGIAVNAMETYCAPGEAPRSADVSLAVFRADDPTSPAVRAFRTPGGSVELPLDSGRYELCDGYSLNADGSRKTQGGMCQKVNIGKGVVRITVSSGMGIFYACEPKEACPR